MLSVLKKYFGYDSFRPMQEEIIRSVLAGRDTLALLPTGGGKSVCFQVPMLVMASERESRGEVGGLCLVVTPLIALMQDQVRNLKNRGILAEAIYSGMSFQRIQAALDNCRFGPYRFLYVSPERLDSENFRAALSTLPIAMIAVDEAHCISQWGYDFRPSYLRINDIRCSAGAGQPLHVPIIALTATATPDVVDDIQHKLGFVSRNVFRTSFRRANLRYVVRHTSDKDAQLLHILSHVEGSSIVYCRSRKRCQELSEFICQNLGTGYADFYHAGLSSADRADRQQRWQSGHSCMVCTNAFGMGIDKPDVRLVIHYDIPSSIEAYFQEAGRAGRDGHTAYAVLLFDPTQDETIARRRVSDSYPPAAYVERVYHAFCDFLEVGAGSGLGHSWSVDVGEICAHMHLQPTYTESSLALLQSAGYIRFEPEAETPARVMITMPRYEIERLRLHDDEQRILDSLMRGYPGICSDLILIASSEESKHRHQVLSHLAAQGIITYVPRRISSRFTLTLERQTAIVMPQGVLDDRRAHFEKLLAAMLTYATQVEMPEETYLVRYFGENN